MSNFEKFTVRTTERVMNDNSVVFRWIIGYGMVVWGVMWFVNKMM